MKFGPWETLATATVISAVLMFLFFLALHFKTRNNRKKKENKGENMDEGTVLKKVVKAALSKETCVTETFGPRNKIIGATALTRSKGVDIAKDIKEVMKERSM
ncbi:hypothetical protein BMS3Abin15_00973 [bacterium BMS3Abin15]|nr:hypothetical protein BMS3Abin15_00973 [bacterium BMS3Abin15]HDZ84960.1 hypothetical protein [Candidatus Moranbacteria bacterium]